jgi:hypothetical protein
MQTERVSVPASHIEYYKLKEKKIKHNYYYIKYVFFSIVKKKTEAHLATAF